MIGIEAEGPNARVVDDLALVIDEVDAGWARGVKLRDPVVHEIDVERHDAIEEVRLAAGCDLAALFERDRFDDIRAGELSREVVHKALGMRSTKPPSIACVGFFDIHDDELDLVVILLIEFFETHGPIAEGRSGVAPEDERDGTFSAEVGEANFLVAFRILQDEVGREVSDLG